MRVVEKEETVGEALDFFRFDLKSILDSDESGRVAKMDEEDLDALIDDENEMETYIDEDEEDMAFLAEQDDEGKKPEQRGPKIHPGRKIWIGWRTKGTTMVPRKKFK